MSPKFISIILAATVFLCSLFGATTAGGVVLAYVTGTKYLQLTPDLRKAWMIGAMDGIMAENLEESRRAYLEHGLSWEKATEKAANSGPWLGDCIAEGYEIMQIKAMFEKELNRHPESWQAPAALILRQRLLEFCKRWN
jgi:hypothetical protein